MLGMKICVVAYCRSLKLILPERHCYSAFLISLLTAQEAQNHSDKLFKRSPLRAERQNKNDGRTFS